MANDNKFFREETCKTGRKAPLRTVNAILTSQHTHDATDRTSRVFLTPSNQNLQALVVYSGSGGGSSGGGVP